LDSGHFHWLGQWTLSLDGWSWVSVTEYITHWNIQLPSEKGNLNQSLRSSVSTSEDQPEQWQLWQLQIGDKLAHKQNLEPIEITDNMSNNDIPASIVFLLETLHLTAQQRVFLLSADFRQGNDIARSLLLAEKAAYHEMVLAETESESTELAKVIARIVSSRRRLTPPHDMMARYRYLTSKERRLRRRIHFYQHIREMLSGEPIGNGTYEGGNIDVLAAARVFDDNTIASDDTSVSTDTTISTKAPGTEENPIELDDEDDDDRKPAARDTIDYDPNDEDSTEVAIAIAEARASYDEYGSDDEEHSHARHTNAARRLFAQSPIPHVPNTPTTPSTTGAISNAEALSQERHLNEQVQVQEELGRMELLARLDQEAAAAIADEVYGSPTHVMDMVQESVEEFLTGPEFDEGDETDKETEGETDEE
jgi:hypothetical protein